MTSMSSSPSASPSPSSSSSVSSSSSFSRLVPHQQINTLSSATSSVLVLCGKDGQSDLGLRDELQMVQRLRLRSLSFTVVDNRADFTSHCHNHQIVHVISHGRSGFFYFLQNQDDIETSSTHVQIFLKSLPASVELVVIHACHADVGFSPEDHQHRNVIVCDTEVRAASFVTFSRALYERLDAHDTVKRAFHYAQAQLISSHTDPDYDIAKDRDKFQFLPSVITTTYCSMAPANHAFKLHQWMRNKQILFGVVGLPQDTFGMSGDEDMKQLEEAVKEFRPQLQALGIFAVIVNGRTYEIIEHQCKRTDAFTQHISCCFASHCNYCGMTVLVSDSSSPQLCPCVLCLSRPTGSAARRAHFRPAAERSASIETEGWYNQRRKAPGQEELG